MAARATRSSSRAASGSDDASRCLLLALSHDELGVIVDGLADPLQPVVAVALSSTCLGLRTPLGAALEVLQERHARARALGRKGGRCGTTSSVWRAPMTCAELRDAELLGWGAEDLTADDMATLGLILPWMPSLKRLYLSSNTFAGAGVQALCERLGRGAAPSLRNLDLSYNKIGLAGAKALAAALRRGAMPKLVVLELGDNIIGNQGVAALAPALKKLPALEILDLGVCGIGDDGVSSLVDNLGKNDFKKLEIMYLENNLLTDKGCAKLVAALKAGGLPAIEALYRVHPGHPDDPEEEDELSEAAVLSKLAGRAARYAVDVALQQRLA